MIKVENVTLKVAGHKILDDVTFEIPRNQIVGLLGHNGAGKSTLYRFIANEEVLQSGNIAINDIANEFGKANDTTLITSRIFLNSRLSIAQNLENLNVNKQLDEAYIKNKLVEFGIDFYASFGSLSSGVKQIVQILFYLAKSSKVFLLDEPFTVIDIFNRKKIVDLMLDAQERGVTIMITTHFIREIELLFDRILYINNGRIEYDLVIDEVLSNGYESIEQFIESAYGGE